MKLPEWANWLARDEHGELWAYSVKPLRREDGFWDLKSSEDKCIGIEETDDTFETVKWTDEEPTVVDKDRNTFKWLEKPDLLPTRETLNEVFGSKPDEKPTEVKTTPLREWVKWLARDENNELWCYATKPYKESDRWHSEDPTGRCEKVDDVSEIYNLIQWTDKEPTEVISGRGTLGISVAELNRIVSAKAHGYDSVPEMVDKTERVHVDKDGVDVTVGEITTMSFEEVMALVENDMIDQPPHYIGNQGLEVEVVLQNFIPRYEDTYVGHRIASAIEYLLRSPLKNQRQDIEKAGKNIQQALAYLDMMEEEK